MLDVKEFINELIPLVRFNKEKHIHYMGSTILTNDEMKAMLSVIYGDEYNNLPNNEQRKLRDYIFDELRGEE
jgi:hypothetical protein